MRWEGTPAAFHLTPLTATVLFVVACLAGYRYRSVWKRQGPAWQAWWYGTVAALALLALAFGSYAAPPHT